MIRLIFALVTALVVQAAPSSTRTLTIDFVALDRAGNPVQDLKPGELEVWVGQFRAPVQRMTVVTPEADERGGRVIVLLLDDMTLPLESVPRARAAARRFVARMSATDQVAVMTMSGTEIEATNDRQKLLRAIDAYAVRAMPVMRSDTLGRHVLETLAAISRQLVEVGGRRKTIVGIGSGWLFDRPLPNPVAGHDLMPEWVHAMREMARTLRESASF